MKMTVNSDADLVAIVGDTNAGKSGLMRALACLLLLDPFFPTIGKNDASVAVDFDDATVERKATFKKTGGKLTKDADEIIVNGKTDEPFTKFHRAMPDGVEAVTRITKLDIQGAPKPFLLNFVRQRDQVLPEAFSPAQIAKLLASVSGRAKIDNSIRETNNEIKQAQSS